jgi:hypothetical protein
MLLYTLHDDYMSFTVQSIGKIRKNIQIKTILLLYSSVIVTTS